MIAPAGMGKKYSEQSGGYPIYTKPALKTLWAGTGVTGIKGADMSFPCEFPSFDEMWFRRYLEGQGPGGGHVIGLPEDRREALSQRLRQNILGGRRDGVFTLKAKALAVRGIVP